MYGSDTISRVCGMVVAVMLQSSAEELSSMSGIDLRDRAKASESDVLPSVHYIRAA